MRRTRDLCQAVRYVSMSDGRLAAAISGVFCVQKYCRALRPTTGMPVAARTAEISLSIFAQPPSPLTKTTSVSELVPACAGTSTTGSFVAAESAGARNRAIDRVRMKRACFIDRAVERDVKRLSSLLRHHPAQPSSDEGGQVGEDAG